MKKEVSGVAGGVRIAFAGEVKKQNIVKMVQNCQTGQCECMSDETKRKITSMEVSGEDGAVELTLGGTVDTEEIEAALARSKVLGE